MRWLAALIALALSACATASVEGVPPSSDMPGYGSFRLPQWEDYCGRHGEDPACKK